MKKLVLFAFIILAISYNTFAQKITIVKTEKGISLDSLIYNWGYFPLQEIKDSLNKHKCVYTTKKEKTPSGTFETILELTNGDLSGFTIPKFSIVFYDNKEKKERSTGSVIKISISHKEFDYKKRDSLTEHPFCTLYDLANTYGFGQTYDDKARNFRYADYEEQQEKISELLHPIGTEEKPTLWGNWMTSRNTDYGSTFDLYILNMSTDDFLYLSFTSSRRYKL